MSVLQRCAAKTTLVLVSGSSQDTYNNSTRARGVITVTEDEG